MLQNDPLLYAFWALREGLTTLNKVTQMNAVGPTRDNTTFTFELHSLLSFAVEYKKSTEHQKKCNIHLTYSSVLVATNSQKEYLNI